LIPGVFWLQQFQLCLGIVGSSQSVVELGLQRLQLAVGGGKELLFRGQLGYGLSGLAPGLLGLDLIPRLLLRHLKAIRSMLFLSARWE
jgi:hypothetical protein